MEETDTLYVIEKAFWDNWCLNVAFNENTSFTIKKEDLKTIDNKKLVEPGHEFRLKEVSYNEDFMIVPK